jgi:competence protein ComEC
MPLFWLSLAFMCGVYFGQAFGPGAGVGVWLGLAGAALTALILRRRLNLFAGRLRLPTLPKAPLPVAALILAACLGAARYAWARPEINPGFIGWYANQGQMVAIRGVINAPPERRAARIRLLARVEALQPAGAPDFETVGGLLLVNLPPGDDWRYGDRIELRGRLEAPPPGSDGGYRDYLNRQGIYAYLPFGSARVLERGAGNPFQTGLYVVRERMLAAVYRMFPEPEASLTAGIVLGDDSGLPPEVQTAFQDTGTAHIIAISGFNIGIVSALFAVLFTRLLGRRRGALMAVLGIAFYTLLVGASASVVRAALMGGLGLLAGQLGRRQDGLNTLALVGAGMLVFNPLWLWDVGYQLSFTATLGLTLYAESLTNQAVRLAAHFTSADFARRIAESLGEYLFFTLAATAASLPVTLYHFGRLSLAALIANPLALPPQPALMILGGLAAALGALSPPLGQLFAWLTWPLAAYTIRVVELLAKLPLAAIAVGPFEAWMGVAYYLILFGWTFARRRAAPLARSLLQPGLALTGLTLMAVVVWRGALAAPDGRLHLTLLETGGGEALLVRAPSGRMALINAGRDSRRLLDGLDRRLPPGATIDWLVVAAPTEDNLAALPTALERRLPGAVLWAGPTDELRLAKEAGSILAYAGVDVIPALAGHSLDLGDDAALEILSVDPEIGAVVQARMGDFRALLPLGVDEAAQKRLLAQGMVGKAHALLLAGGGSASLNPPEWIAAWNPDVILVSPPLGDPAHPARQALEAASGRTILRTDRNGWIDLATNGKQVWVTTER